jgi:hypothetical protein
MANKETIITGAMIILITYTLSLSLVSQAFPATQTTKTLSSAGSIQIQTSAEIGVYSNPQCTTPLTSLSWGTLEPGGSQTRDCYIKNEGDTALTLSLETSNWNPTEAASHLTLNWNYNENPVDPDAVVHVTFTLSVSPNIQGITSFSFDINIVGTS